MPRPCKCRLVGAGPPVTGFRPIGLSGCDLEVIELRLDELEALRLADMEGLYHDEAAKRMGISRPTFGRLIESARRKTACALFQSNLLIFKGGSVVTNRMRRFACSGCGGPVDAPRGRGRPKECPKCKGRSFCCVVGRGRGRKACQVVADNGSNPKDMCCRRRRAGWTPLVQTVRRTRKGRVLHKEKTS